MDGFPGGGEAKGMREKDYQQVLTALLRMDDRFSVATEAEPADRQRLDILLRTAAGTPREAVLELKLYQPSREATHRGQLRDYLAQMTSTSEMPVEGHLVLFDRREEPDWSGGERHREVDGVHVWLVHVNRPPPSGRKRQASSDAGAQEPASDVR